MSEKNNSSDWRSYDGIAQCYDQAWGARFEAVARRIWILLAPRTGSRVLDIGTGTGIVLRTLQETNRSPHLIVGCDRSWRMLQQARNRVTGFCGLVTQATALPIATGTFDIATASFVLSHVQDYPAALAEVLRVLKPSGQFAVSNWVPPTDAQNALWREWLAQAISKQELERALAEVAPCEEYFSDQGRLESALTQAGFSVIAAEAPEFEFTLTVDEFIQERELGSSGRLGRHLLGDDVWAHFRAGLREQLITTFGFSCRYRSRSLIVIGEKRSA